ncbi:MAG: DUF1559 domain-containing protein [Pirellulaceae bacterium]
MDDFGFSLHVRLLPFLDGDNTYRRIKLGQFYSSSDNRRVTRHDQSVFYCASNPDSSPAESHDYTNYVGSAGGGDVRVQNGMFVNLALNGIVTGGSISDGRSNTVAMSEAITYPQAFPGVELKGKGAVLETATRFILPASHEDFVQACIARQGIPTNHSLGVDWMAGSIAYTRFIHILPPNSQNCRNQMLVDVGLYAPSSFHAGGVNALFADNSIRFVEQSISRKIWEKYGTRAAGNEPSLAIP